jgi:hypothetical protein
MNAGRVYRDQTVHIIYEYSSGSTTETQLIESERDRLCYFAAAVEFAFRTVPPSSSSLTSCRQRRRRRDRRRVRYPPCCSAAAVVSANFRRFPCCSSCRRRVCQTSVVFRTVSPPPPSSPSVPFRRRRRIRSTLVSSCRRSDVGGLTIGKTLETSTTRRHWLKTRLGAVELCSC